MADKKSKIEEVAAEGVSVAVTHETPAEADKTSVPNALDAEANQPPVRTNRPDVPIAQSLGSGAGAHEPRVLDKEVAGIAVDADGLDADGHFVGKP